MKVFQKKIGFIGNFGDKNIIGGQIAKTRELFAAMLRRKNVSQLLVDEFLREGLVKEEILPDCFSVLDLNNKNYFYFVTQLVKVFSTSHSIVIIMSSSSYFKLLPVFSFLNRIYKRVLYEFVIGGTRQERIGKRELYYEKQFKRIFVESNYMKNSYYKLGLYNTMYMPNFKCVSPISVKEVENRDFSVVKCCTYSRIDEKKGVDIAIKVMNYLMNKSNKITLDIIGPVDNSYRKAFEELLKNAPQNVKYVGYIDGNISKQILQKYDILVFPTQWETEGFPGSFIDAMQAGLVILSTDKENFKDVIHDGENGFLLHKSDITGFAEKILELSLNYKKLRNMQKKSLSECIKYDTDIVIKEFLEEIGL